MLGLGSEGLLLEHKIIMFPILPVTPHFLPYQGSKRKLAPSIFPYVPKNVDTIYEPFAGSAAMSIYCANHGIGRRFVIGDVLEPLVQLLEEVVEHPDRASDSYEAIWDGQSADDPQQRYDYFFEVRVRYGETRSSADLLFLIARCVANAIRFSKDGRFTQSPDKRRMGTKPQRMRENIHACSRLLRGRTDFVVGDFRDTIQAATPADLVYMDPPYEGTANTADKRYAQQLTRERVIECLEDLNARGVPWILSYDGRHGDKTYGEPLPEHLGSCMELEAGRSTQGTLSGREIITYESLYMSEGLTAEQPQRELFSAQR